MGATSWWEDTVYGYIKSRLEEVRGKEEDKIDQLLTTRCRPPMNCLITSLMFNTTNPILSINADPFEDQSLSDLICSVLFCFVLFCSVLFCSVLFYLSYSVLFRSITFFSVLS